MSLLLLKKKSGLATSLLSFDSLHNRCIEALMVVFLRKARDMCDEIKKQTVSGKCYDIYQ